jgi:nicotinamide riboside kinase
MRIGLVGAPESGKSDLAIALAAALKDKGVVMVVDDYVEQITDRSDTALGSMATYLGNLQVAVGRMEFENKALEDSPDVLITCGTIIDTIVYNALHHMVHLSTRRKDQRILDHYYERADASTKLLALMMADTWKYDHVFYLPLSEDGQDWYKEIDKELAPAIRMTGAEFTTLDDDDKLEAALNEINSITASATPD